MCWCLDETKFAIGWSPIARGEMGRDRMGMMDFVVVLVGSVLVIGGAMAIAARELGTHPERRLVGPVRDAAEVLLPLIGAIGLVVSVWISVS